VVVEPTPSSSFEVAEPHLLLELQIVVLDAPAQLRVIDQATQADVLGKRRKPVLGRLLFPFRPLNEQPLFRPAFGELVITMSDAHAHARKPCGEWRCHTFAPSDFAPST